MAVRRLHRGSAPQGRVDALLQGRHLHREGQQQAKKTSAVQYIRFLSLRNNLSDYVGGTLPLKYRNERRFASYIRTVATTPTAGHNFKLLTITINFLLFSFEFTCGK